ncbi:MAG: anti-sigma factor [Pseudomonadota bacterium]
MSGSGPAAPPDGEAPLAAEHALRLLEGEDRAAFERRLRDEPALRAELAAWEARLAPLAEEIAEVAPPARVKRAVEARLFGPAAAVAAPGGGAWAFWRGAAAALAATAGLAALLIATDPGPGPMLAAQIETEDGALRVLAVYDPATRRLRLTRLGGAAPAGRTYELWAIPPGGQPVSLGLLPGGRGEAAPPGALGGAVLAISEEPEGGSPTGAPTGPVVATAEVVEL